MKKQISFYTFLAVVIASCATVQSIVKSTFPYTATLAIPASSATGTSQNTVSMGSSFDQNFVKDGNNATKVKEVHITSAKLTVNEPSGYNIGNI